MIRSLIIEIVPWHYECIGMAVEYLLTNYKQDSIDLYIPNILDRDKGIIDFFIDNYKGIINISVVKKLSDEYNSIFFLTSESYDKINLQCKYNSIQGIAHSTNYHINISPTDNISSTIANNLTIRYTNKIATYIPFHFRLLVDKDKYISMATLHKYNYIKYFFTGCLDEINLNRLERLLGLMNEKIICVYKRGNIIINNYKNIILIRGTNIMNIIYLFMTKTLIFYPYKNSMYEDKCSASFHLAASFNTPALVPETIYNNHNLKLYPNFIPYDSDCMIKKYLKPDNHVISFRNIF